MIMSDEMFLSDRPLSKGLEVFSRYYKDVSAVPLKLEKLCQP